MAEIRNPVKAIKAFCIDCMGGSYNEVKNCTSQICALHPFRMGRNPYRTTVKRELTEEQREELRERMRKVQSAQKSKNIERSNQENSP